MDRFTWGVVLGVLVLAAVAVVQVATRERASAPPDLTTPEGTVRAYIEAIQERRAEDAWRLLEGPEALGRGYGPRGEPITEADFQRQVASMPTASGRRIRVLPSRTSGTATIVDVEVMSGSEAPFFLHNWPLARKASFRLREVDGQWRITAAPSVWEVS